MCEVGAAADAHREQKGDKVRRFSKQNPEAFVLCSERIVLGCGCGESLILLGLEEDWRSEGTVFECECGAKLTLADRIEQEVPGIRELLHGAIRAPGT